MDSHSLPANGWQVAGDGPPAPPPTPTCWTAGLDLGQTGDYSAWVVIEQPPVPDGTPRAYRARDARRWPLGTPYPAIVADVLARMALPPLAPDGDLVIDATGVGRPVLDLFRLGGLGGRLTGVTITAGNEVTRPSPDEVHVPKTDLISGLTVLLQTGRLTIAAALPEAATLRRELELYQRRITANAHVTFGQWRTGEHDDLLLALAVALWYAERGRSRPTLYVF